MRWLGKTGLQVSELCLGTATFGGLGHFKVSGEVSQEEANRIVRAALDAGINLFNTAELYSEGLAEEILGNALGSARKNAIVISKVAHVAPVPGLNTGGHSRKHIMEACEASLRRLRTDYIDIYELHGMDPNTPLEITLRALDDLVRQGKVRYIGCSNFTAWMLMKAMGISDKNGWEKFLTLEAMYSLADRALEQELIPACVDQGIAVLSYSPLHAGLLSGKYRRNQPWPAGTRIQSAEEPQWPFEPDQIFNIVDVLDEIARERNVAVPQVALNYVLKKPCVCSLIIGTRKISQLAENLKAMEWQMTAEETERLDRVSEPRRLYRSAFYWRRSIP
jgi:aryl-alcohol dehydrogenase-like predicted oxidoreductase